VLDKTGTLTTGAVRLLRIDSLRGDAPQACLALAAALEAGSAHPIAAALRLHAAPAVAARDIVAVPGQGVEGTVDGKRYRLGRPAWVDEICATPCPGGAATDGATLVALADEAGPLARLQFGDALRDSAARLVASLRGAGLRVSLVSGDGPAAVARVAAAVGIDDWRAEVSPEDKRAFVAALQRRGAIVAMIGDGVNDAPSLACADVSLTLGSAAALTQWSADVVVLGDDLGGVAFALRAARRAVRVIRQNLGWALAYNAFAIPLAASGELSPVAAAIGMSASSLIVVGNAWRLARPGASAAERSGAHARQPRAASAAC
jgi:Cu2+-exporting ATPase